MTTRQRFTPEFKREAVRLLDNGDKAAAEVALAWAAVVCGGLRRGPRALQSSRISRLRLSSSATRVPAAPDSR
jgi:transposase-like protein